MTFLAFMLNRPIEPMKGFRPASPSASIFSGVSATWKSFSVALLTETSVAWAESATATTRVNGPAWSSSVRGSLS